MQRRKIEIPGWFRTVSVLALVWHLVGIAGYVYQATLTPARLSSMPEQERLLLEAVPSWASTAAAAAVFAGALGALMLLLRSKLAVPLFFVSLAGVLVNTFHTLVLSAARQVYGNFALVMPLIATVIALYLLLVSAQARNNGWLR